MSFTKLKEVIGDNTEALELVRSLEGVQSSLTDRVSFLEKDSKSAFDKRDKAIGELKEAKELLGLDDLTEETLKALKKPKDDSAELLNLQSLLEQANTAKVGIEDSFNSFKQGVVLDKAITEAGVSSNVANPEMFKIVKNLLQDGAKVIDNQVIYLNQDGTTMYNEGKPVTIADRVNSIASDEAYAGLFKPKGSGGSGSKGNTGGVNTPSVDLSKLNTSEKGKLMSELGHDKYMTLAQSQYNK